MLKTYSEKNQFGGYTHEILITPSIMLRFTEMDTHTIEIELIQKKFLGKNKVHFSFITHESLGGAVIVAITRMKIDSRNLPFTIDFGMLNRIEDNVLAFILENRHELSKSTIVKL